MQNAIDQNGFSALIFLYPMKAFDSLPVWAIIQRLIDQKSVPGTLCTVSGPYSQY